MNAKAPLTNIKFTLSFASLELYLYPIIDHVQELTCVLSLN